MIFTAPSILSADFLNLEKDILSVLSAKADIIHLDIMDGHFVPNLTFGFPIISQIRKITNAPLDAHFMVTNPQDYLDDIEKAAIDYVSFHYEVVPHAHRLIQQLKKIGCKAGIALNPATPVNVLEDILSDLDFVLIMSVNPGFGGQKFIPQSIQKIKKLKEMIANTNRNILIEVDGGVTDKNAPKLIDAGVNILVAGSFIFNADDYKLQIEKLTGR